MARQLLQLQSRSNSLALLLATEYDQGSTAVRLAACNVHYRVILVALDCAWALDLVYLPRAPRAELGARTSNTPPL